MFYLDGIINSEKNKKDIVIDIIKARGFFIEEKGSKYYISDNAALADVKYLKTLFKEYNIGKITDNRQYVTKRRMKRTLGFRPEVYKYQSIIPETIEIIINDDVTVESAIDLFLHMGQNGAEAGPSGHKWLEFVIEKLPGKVSVAELEAYVAFYVKAVSACGVQTYYSCDGNHKNGGRIYVNSNYPWELWHFCLWKYIVQEKFGDVPYIEKGIVFDETNKKEVYQLVYDIATYLYDNRVEIRRLKNLTVENITKKYRKMHSEKEIEQFYLEECERILRNTVFKN